jgi:translation initiation factor 1 (eIF-1/SUI1)
LGNWKDYEDLEENLSMPELTSTLTALRESKHRDQKFFAAIQGIDLDKNSNTGGGQKEWEDLKSRVFSSGQASDSDDILSLQGQNAAKAGFGIGAGLEYTDLKGEQPKNPFG